MATSNSNLFFEAGIEGDSIKRKFLSFLNEYEVQGDTDETERVKYYKLEAENMQRNKRNTIYVDFQHLIDHSTTYDLAEVIQTEYYKYQPFLRKALTEFMHHLHPDFVQNKLLHVSFTNLPEVDTLRDIKSDKIGKLMSIVGTITKTTEVRPELLYGCFACELCGKKIKDVEQQFKYTTPKLCGNRACTNKTKWRLVNEESTFTDWQKLRIQENSNDIPAGSMPRSIDVIIRADQVEKGQPGDRCIFVGTPVVVPDLYSMLKPGEKYQLTSQNAGIRDKNSMSMQGITGLKSTGVRDLNYKIVFICNNIQGTENRFGIINIRGDEDKEVLENMTEQEKSEILHIKGHPRVYEALASSICPMVFGNEEIKKGILLMLFGGVHKKTSEGIKLRGDLNICVVGDPSTAKSQFLKFVHGFLPRSVYTSGKATSAAGLTASVQRDPETGEFTIEAGALMLADNGICCIDEFDKMDDQDQVAIHEAMEQQTISITKAGIQATLNARTSILAAANPIMGRYDKSKTLKYNLNISPPIMSRFDLFFVVCDDCDEVVDTSIARHIVKTHQMKEDEQTHKAEFSIAEMQRYIRFARSIKPQITREASLALRECYIRLRSSELGYKQSSYRITVRQLESLIRLSEALARVHCATEISADFVRESARLLGNSILKVHKPDMEIEPFSNTVTTKTENPIIEQVQQTRKSKITLKAEEYEHMAQAMTLQVREQELLQGAKFRGVKQGDLINWYITKELDNLTGMSDFNKLKLILNAVIKRLIRDERTFIIETPSENPDERTIKIHPNHYME